MIFCKRFYGEDNAYRRMCVVLICIFLIGCETTIRNPEWWMEREINACVPTAIIFRESLIKYNVWAEVVRYSWIDEKRKLRGHAMVVYKYPIKKPQLWTYDREGSFRINASARNVEDVAQKAHWVRGWYGNTFNAEYLNEN